MPGPAALASIVALGVICTAIGLVVFFRLITEAGPTRASVITYVNPIVAVVIGVLAAGKRLGSMSMAGLLLILAGSWLSTDGRRHAAEARA
jgi:drug/metabolite transporter (DMT)-like permease